MKRALILATLIALLIAAMTWKRERFFREKQSRAAAYEALDDGVFRTVVLGDSVAYGAGDESGLGIAGRFDRELQRLGIRASHTLNLGINGARTAIVRRHLRREDVRAAIRTADALILSIGGNDLYGDQRSRLFASVAPRRRIQIVLGRVERLIREIRRINPVTQIYLLGLYNPYTASRFVEQQVNAWDGRLIVSLASSRNLTVIRIADLLALPDRLSTRDRFHPGAAGYAAIAARIAAAL